MVLTTVVSPLGDTPVPPSTFKPGLYIYDLRLEVIEKTPGQPVPLFPAFLTIMEEIEKLGVFLAADDAHGTRFTISDLKTMKDFSTRFNVTSTNRSTRKAMMGFQLHSSSTLTHIKNHLIGTLQSNSAFLRIHKGGLDQLQQTTLGFLLNAHPRVANFNVLSNQLNASVQAAWKNNVLFPPSEKARLVTKFPSLVGPNQSIRDLPVQFQTGQVFSRPNGKTSVKSDAITVLAPSSMTKELRFLFDLVLQKTTYPEEFIPTTLIRSSPDTYHKLVCLQAKFMHNHRRLQILNVPLKNLSIVSPAQNEALLPLLKLQKNIHRICFDASENRILLSTTEALAPSVNQWLDRILPTFPYQPTRASSTDSQTTLHTTNSNDRYAKLISTLSFTSNDESTIQSTRKFTGWNKNPPPEILVQFDKEFPPLAKTSPHDVSLGPTTTTTTQVTDQIKQALEENEKKWEARLASLLEKHQNTIHTLQQQQIQLLEQMSQLVSQKTSTPAPTPQPTQTNVNSVQQEDLSPIWTTLERIQHSLIRLEYKMIEDQGSPARKKVNTGDTGEATPPQSPRALLPTFNQSPVSDPMMVGQDDQN